MAPTKVRAVEVARTIWRSRLVAIGALSSNNTGRWTIRVLWTRHLGAARVGLLAWVCGRSPPLRTLHCLGKRCLARHGLCVGMWGAVLTHPFPLDAPPPAAASLPVPAFPWQRG